MARLRDPVSGCAWDRAQSFATIAPYTVEEAYEVADAIAHNDLDAIRAELGDLLLQVVFHARIAEELDAFALGDVATAIADKMEARHPHIFGDAALRDTSLPRCAPPGGAQWEAIKERERARAGAISATDGVALALPALMRAEKLQKRAARVGFDWPDPTGPAQSLASEIAELAEAPPSDRFEEAGDVLFSAVNLLRAYGIAPEDALRAGNAKFERRFRAMEVLASAEGQVFGDLTLAEQEALWRQVKIAAANARLQGDEAP